MSEAEIIAAVIQAPPDQWGERWLIAQRAQRTYRPGRASFRTYLERACRSRRVDRWRRSRHDHLALACPIDDRQVQAPAPDDGPDLRHPLVGMALASEGVAGTAWNLMARGLTQRQAALAMGRSRGTVASLTWSMRRKLGA